MSWVPPEHRPLPELPPRPVQGLGGTLATTTSGLMAFWVLGVPSELSYLVSLQEATHGPQACPCSTQHQGRRA